MKPSSRLPRIQKHQHFLPAKKGKLPLLSEDGYVSDSILDDVLELAESESRQSLKCNKFDIRRCLKSAQWIRQHISAEIIKELNEIIEAHGNEDEDVFDLCNKHQTMECDAEKCQVCNIYKTSLWQKIEKMIKREQHQLGYLGLQFVTHIFNVVEDWPAHGFSMKPWKKAFGVQRKGDLRL